MRNVAYPVLVCLTLAAGIAAVGAFAADSNGVRAALLATPFTASLGGATTIDDTGADAFTHLAANAPKDRQKDFNLGSRLFAIEWVPFPNAVKIFDGLGPTFNHDACSGCHQANGRGRPPETPGDLMDTMLVRLSAGDGGSLFTRNMATSSTTAQFPGCRRRGAPSSTMSRSPAPTATGVPTRCSGLGSPSPARPSAHWTTLLRAPASRRPSSDLVSSKLSRRRPSTHSPTPKTMTATASPAASTGLTMRARWAASGGRRTPPTCATRAPPPRSATWA